MVKEAKFIRVPCVEPPFIEGGCCIKSFPFMVINTSARVVVRGVVRSPRNIK